MNIVTALVLALVLLSAPTAADEPSAAADGSPTGSEQAPDSPTEEPAGVRPDFTTVEKHLVVVKDELESAKQAPGFSISAQGHIVTSAGELRDRPSYLVSTADGRVFSASKIKADEHTGVWILKLSNADHGLTGLPFARTALQAAARLHAVTFNPSGSGRFTPVVGTVTQLVQAEQGQMIRHNALFSLASAGTPLLNRCYQAVGVNVLQKQGLFRRAVDPIQEGSAQSIASASLGSLLASLNLSLPVADTECLSLEEETRRQVAQAQQEQEETLQRERAAAEQLAQEKEAALQQEKEEAEQKVQQVQQEKEAALQRERAAEQLAQEKEAALQQERVAAERLAQEAEQLAQEKEASLQERTAAEQLAREAGQRERQTLLYASIAGGVLVLGIVGALWSKRRRLRIAEEEKQRLSGNVNQMQSELSYAEEQDRLRSTAPDVFLEGETPPIALKIPGASLVERAGAVVGRSPAASTFVINHEQISRQHFRLTLVSHQIMIEDLGSTNGTSVDGVPLEPSQHLPVREGSRLALGDLELTLHIGG